MNDETVDVINVVYKLNIPY